MSRPSRFAVATLAALCTTSLLVGGGAAQATPSPAPSAAQTQTAPPTPPPAPNTAACRIAVEADGAAVGPARSAFTAAPEGQRPALEAALTAARAEARGRLCTASGDVTTNAACAALVEASEAVRGARRAVDLAPARDRALREGELLIARDAQRNLLCTNDVFVALRRAPDPQEQTQPVGGTFAPLVAEVIAVAPVALPARRDEAAAPIPGVTVTFALQDDAPATFISPADQRNAPRVTNAAGRASSPQLRAGPGTGTAVVIANASTTRPPFLTFPLTITAAPPNGGTTPVSPGIAVAGGNGQSITVGTAFPTPLSVQVTPGTVPPLPPGTTVTFAVTSGNATFPAAAEGAAPLTSVNVPTGVNGLTNAPALTAGPTPGPVAVLATLNGVPAPAPTAPFGLNIAGAGASASADTDRPGMPDTPIDPDQEVDQQAADGSEAAAGGDQVEEVPLGSVDTGGWS